jgi:phage terminase small subunit
MSKLTPKQEAFCLAYVETGNASEAYRRAYDASRMKDATIHVKASELLSDGKVTVRLEELRQGHAERHEVTVDSLVRELDEARLLAIATKAPAAAVSATMGKGKLIGLVAEKSHVRRVEDMSDTELHAVVRKYESVDETARWIERVLEEHKVREKSKHWGRLD